MKRIIERSVVIAWIPVIVFLISSFATAVYGTYLFIKLLYYTIACGMYMNIKVVIADLLSVIDMYLLVIIQMIFSMGLYELFIGPLKTPDWLHIETIDDLKAALASFITLFLTIVFVQFTVKADSMTDVLTSGAGIAAVMGVLVYYYRKKASSD